MPLTESICPLLISYVCHTLMFQIIKQIYFQVPNQQNRSGAVLLIPQTITPPTYFTVGMMFFPEMRCYFYAAHNEGHTFQNGQLLPTEYFPESLGDHQDVFWQN